jgi:hypothetical protein
MDAPAVYHKQLLAKARGLAIAGHFEYAVVAAHTAFEMDVRNLIHDVGASVMPAAVAEVRLRDKQSQALFTALIGPIVDAGELWTDYNTHALRRNGVVHDGASVDEAGAEESINVVRRLIYWIEKAAEKHA